MMAKVKQFKVLHPSAINVNGIQRQSGEVFDDPKSDDIKPLLANKYIEEV